MAFNSVTVGKRARDLKKEFPSVALGRQPRLTLSDLDRKDNLLSRARAILPGVTIEDLQKFDDLASEARSIQPKVPLNSSDLHSVLFPELSETVHPGLTPKKFERVYNLIFDEKVFTYKRDAEAVKPYLKKYCATVRKVANAVLLDNNKQNEEICAREFNYGAPKTKKRILDKTERDYGGDLERVTDMVRARMDLETEAQIASIMTALSFFNEDRPNIDMPYSGVLSKYKNNFLKGTDTLYRNGLVVVSFPVPDTDRYHSVELQVRAKSFEEHLKSTRSSRSKKDSHGSYELCQASEMRNLAKQFSQFSQEIRQIHTNAWRNTGLSVEKIAALSDKFDRTLKDRFQDYESPVEKSFDEIFEKESVSLPEKVPHSIPA